MDYARYAGSRLRTGTLTAHEKHRLMLLGSPPDMVRGHSLRKTDPAAVCGGRITKDIIRYGFRKGNKNFLKKVKKGLHK